MTGSSNQRREPGGQPTGGQFAAQDRPGADVALHELSDAEYNAEGTFTYPPRPRSASQHIAFWESVPIPDQVLVEVHRAYEQARDTAITSELNRLSDEWLEENPRPDSPKYSGPKIRGTDAMAAAGRKWEESGFAFRAENEKRLESEWPHMPVFEIRDVVRVHHMIEDANRYLSYDEAEAVAKHEMPWQGGVTTADGAYRTYRTWHIRGVLRPNYSNP
ncbi:hypothetical protein GCG21_13755 [Pseudactinotalea sp. HY160]|nr:hypothetical protein [Pseudactinotalea sp. HY160]